MAKNKISYICNSCGSGTSKWFGKCPHCGEWNSLQEAVSHIASSRKIETTTLSELNASEMERLQTSMKEFNLVCGGGIVPGSVILIGGEPGIGKSTIALQLTTNIKTLYIAGEESPLQIKNRADRLNIKGDNVILSSAVSVEDISSVVQKEKPQCLIVDSIQTIYTEKNAGIAGSITQLRDSASELSRVAKESGIPVILIGHITKEGSIAGPKVLEHLVDTVLYFEGDFTRDYRILRAFKNRFGSVNEIALFQMSSTGLIEVQDKNDIFMNAMSSSPGSAVSAAIEGSRTILFEVQSLVSFTSFSNPRRMADGFDLNRLILMVAVLEKHAGLQMSSFDVFLNVSGGFNIKDTSCDLAVTMAIASSLKDKTISKGTGFLGEITLSGEIRPVSQCSRRIYEFNAAGFNTLFVAAQDKQNASEFKGEIITVSTIAEVVAKIL